MDDMIDLQPATVVDTLKAVDAAARGVASWIQEAGDAPVVVVGVGTGGHAARGVTVALNAALGDSTGRRVEFRESEDQARAPRKGGVCIAVSHGGLTVSTLNALAAARATGARTAVIIAAPSSFAHDLADLVLQLPMRDKSYCHTVGYTSPIAAGLQIGSHLNGELLDMELVASYLQQSVTALRAAAASIGPAWKDVERLISAGSLVDEPSARELALDFAEAAWIPASPFGVEDVLHGQMVGHDSKSALTITLTGGPEPEAAAATAEKLLRAAGHIGLHVTLIASEDISSLIAPDSTPEGRLVIPSTTLPPVVQTLLGGAIALQALTMSLVYVRGTNPDFLRREQQQYREAVPLGGAKRTASDPRH
ncbi:hypothetical protein BTO20_00415 [Mycobacterium dioxanotrophicus]|uniref:SIS domain-containing protein n=2 Tax=Mycobacterium dioxanotrophicus TaxID=482462 RepID=A0A1Y0BWM1_9MYCO|nr:hypothetical protein BTO20_00415 [Mycobacterium dioxanotrophicus]